MHIGQANRNVVVIALFVILLITIITVYYFQIRAKIDMSMRITLNFAGTKAYIVPGRRGKRGEMRSPDIFYSRCNGPSNVML